MKNSWIEIHNNSNTQPSSEDPPYPSPTPPTPHHLPRFMTVLLFYLPPLQHQNWNILNSYSIVQPFRTKHSLLVSTVFLIMFALMTLKLLECDNSYDNCAHMPAYCINFPYFTFACSWWAVIIIFQVDHRFLSMSQRKKLFGKA